MGEGPHGFSAAGHSRTDPVGGDLNVRTYDEASGRIDVELIGVTLQNPSTGTVCRIDGRLQTYRLSF